MSGWDEEIKKELGYCGKNVYIGKHVIFTNPKKVILHDNVRIDPFCLITSELEVGEYTQICSHAVLGGGAQHKITLEGWNFIGYGSKLFCASEDYSGDYGPVNEFWGNNKIFRGNITFKKYSGIASDVVVLPGVTFPEGCTIGASSFVYSKSELTEWSVYIGNPLKFHKSRNKENVITLSNDPNFIKERKKTAKVICTFFGDRRQHNNTPSNVTDFLKLMIENEINIENGVYTDIIIVNNDCGNVESNKILKSYDGTKTKNGRIIVEDRENLGGSFGAYYYAFLKYKDNYDYWFFCEDDVLVFKENYMSEFITFLDSNDNLGFVALAPITKPGTKIHSGGGCGLTSTDKFLKSRPIEYMNNHFTVSEKRSNDYESFQYYEIDFTNVFIRSGMLISNHPNYSPFAENYQKHGSQMNHFENNNQEQIYKVGF
jgi:acetyltransferase-like isoleucine patch superfamily enzyme